MTGDGTRPPTSHSGTPASVQRLPAALSHLAVERTPVGLMLVDDDYRIRWVNAGFRQLLAARATEPVGALLGELVSRPAYLSPSEPGPGGGWQSVRLGQRPEDRLVLMTGTPAEDRGLRLFTFLDPWEEGLGGPSLSPGLHRDPVNRLASVWLFEDRLRHALERSSRPAQPVGLLLARLDQREALRERLGAEGLEALLQQVERRLAQTLRREDSLSRLSEGCWGILIEHPRSPAGLQTAALRCLEAMEPPFRARERAQQLLSLSIGIAISPGDGETADQLLCSAESALSRVEPGRHTFFDAALRRRLAGDLAFRQQLQEALLAPERHFRVVYQPQLDLRSGRCVGVEALVRWRHPERGLLLPGDFLPVVAELGQQVRLDRWVLGAVVAQHAAWRAAGSPLADLAVAVNLCAEMLDQEVFDRRPLDVFLRHQAIEPGWLSLELAQGELVAQAAANEHLIKRLRALGVELVVNDLGRGGLDLMGLAGLAVSRAKLSRSLIAALPEGASREGAALAALLQGLRMMGMEAVAVGVETPAQLASVRALGIDMMQGNELGAPLSAERLEAWLAPA